MIYKITVQEYTTANGGQSFSLGVDGAAVEPMLYVDRSEPIRPEDALPQLLRMMIREGGR